MEWYEIKVDGRKSVKFPEKVLPSNITAEKRRNYSNNVNKLGGIIKKGEWGWLAKDATLQIVSLKYGHTVSTFEFAESRGYENCVITCVDQVFPHESKGVYLAVCMERMTGGSFAAIYSVDHSTVLSCMEVQLRVSCCRFVESKVCTRSLLQNFNGCLALGSVEGAIVLLDLNMAKILARTENRTQDDVFIPCHVIDYNMPLLEIHRNFKECQQDGVHFGLQIEVMENPCSVRCLLPIDLTLSLAVGMEDGRLILYDLTELQIFYVANAEKHNTQAPLIKMDFLEPPDDPRPCFYLWSLHEDEKSLTAVLHSLLYEKRVIGHDVDNFCFLEIFQSSYVRLILPLGTKNCRTISCQSITKLTAQGEDDANCLCAFTWYSENEHKNKLMIFDLNQWYKEEMPFSMDLDRNSNYLAGYVINGQNCSLHSFINPDTIAHFNSLQRFEEHFYPSSLSFDFLLLMRDSCISYSWEGVQNRFINILRSSNASIFLEPDTYFNEIVRTRLMPQFYEHNSKTSISKSNKYDMILSVALEYNCFSLLRDCAKCWVDGSFMGNLSITTGITLSTLTDWAWKRATDIKSRCNDLSKGLFDFGGYPLDQREQKELGYISRQLKLLADLQNEVMNLSKPHIPEKVHNNLEQRYKSLRMASDYQEILLWLLNIGLLPEASPYNSKLNINHELVPYPYKVLKELYATKRNFFGKISDNIVSKKTGRCRLLYIDALIEHECKENVLREYWLENNGDGVYPPTSIEAMLRIMLVPDMSYESKCAVLLYFFLDLNMTINDEAYKNVVANFIKFPSVFKLSASLIKTVQAFWNLDHGHFLPAVDEFISPFNKNQTYPQWLLELLTETLLTQNAANLALRILEARPCLISPVLKLQTLLANELISEAFHFARSKQDDMLLEQFFKCCLCNGKFGVIRDLALSEKEGQLVQDILKNSKTQNAENLHFVYLLQKSKYIEAVSYMDEISKSKCMRTNAGTLNTPNLVMAAYNTTMTPVTQGLTDVYFRIKNKIRKKETDNKSPVPLSCQLIKQNANNLLGGIYHSSALSAHFATYYWGEMENAKNASEDTNSLLNSNNAPFLRKAQMDTNFLDFEERNALSYPRIYKVTEKRTLAECEVQDTSEYEKVNVQENPKKRRKVMGDELMHDLSNVMQMSKNMTHFNKMDFLAQPSEMEKDTTENFLTQPPCVRARSQPPTNDIVNNTVKLLASSEIHGILKTNTPEPMDRHSLRKDMAMEDESKNIRFDLPSSESEPEEESVCEEGTKEEMNNDETIVSQQGEPKKVVTRSVSVDSSVSISSSSSSKVLSEENFYSPISSQNNSLAIDNSLNDTKNSPMVISNRSNLSEGPRARKPLERHSVEQREESISKSPKSKVLDTSFIKELSPNKTQAEKPGISPKLSPLTKHIFNQSGEKKLFTLDTRNSGILDETMSPPIFVTSLKSSPSIVKEFVPKVSSSKVVETHSQFSSERIERTETQVKISEHSTVIGSLTFVDSNLESSKDLEHAKVIVSEAATSKYPTVEQLDTTLGMSSCDLTLLDSIAEPQTKPCIQLAKPEMQTILESKNDRAVSFADETDLYGDLETNAHQESNPGSELLYEKESRSESDVIVLSSSDDEEEDKKSNSREIEDSEELEDSLISFPNEEYDEEGDDDDGEYAETSRTSPEYENTDIDDDQDDDGEDYDNDEDENDPAHRSEIEFEEEISSKEPPEAESGIELKESKAQSNLRKLNIYADSKVSLVDICDDDEEGLAEEEQDEMEVDNCMVEEDVVKESTERGTSVDQTKIEKEKNDVDEDHCVIEEVVVKEVKSSDRETNVDNELTVEEKHDGEEVKSTKNENKDHGELELKESLEAKNSLMPEGVESTKSVHDVQRTETQEPEKSDMVEVSKFACDSSIISSSILEKNVMAVAGSNLEQTIAKPISTVLISIESEPIQSNPLNDFGNRSISALVEDNQVAEKHPKQVKKPDVKDNFDDPTAGEIEVIEIKSSTSDLKIFNLTQSDDTMTSTKENNSEVITVTSSKDDLKSSSVSIITVEESEDSIIKAAKINSSEVITVTSSDDILEHPINEDSSIDRLYQSTKYDVEAEISETNRDEKLSGTSVVFVQETKDNHAAEEIDEHKEFKEKQEDFRKEKARSSMQAEKAFIESPAKERGIRAGSVPAKTTLLPVIGSLTPKARSSRRLSIDEDKTLHLTPRTRRSMRASSMQPMGCKEKEDVVILTDSEDAITPNHSRRSFVKRGASVPPTSDTQTREPIKRGTSQPPAGITPKKISSRRTSLLDTIDESSSVLDSPSTRTRSRLRLNSNDSDLETSLLASEQPPQAKRSRKNSTPSIAEQPASTPGKRSRRNSVSKTLVESVTPRSLRPRSVITVQEEAGPSTKSRTPKRKTSIDESLNETIVIEGSEEDVRTEQAEINKSVSDGFDEKQKQKTSPKHESSEASSSYSLSRRLTRTQLAMMEKSAALIGVSIHDLTGSSSTLATQGAQTSPKRVTRRRTSRSTAASQHESDDAESVVSHKSSKSNSAATRRVTRSSVKDKDEADDDLISVHSSVGSEKPNKRRSNESKNSPGSKLPAIPEDESDGKSVEAKKPKPRRGKH